MFCVDAGMSLYCSRVFFCCKAVEPLSLILYMIIVAFHGMYEPTGGHRTSRDAPMVMYGCISYLVFIFSASQVFVETTDFDPHPRS